MRSHLVNSLHGTVGKAINKYFTTVPTQCAKYNTGPLADTSDGKKSRTVLTASTCDRKFNHINKNFSIQPKVKACEIYVNKTDRM